MSWKEVYEAEMEMRKTLHRQRVQAHDATERAECEFVLGVSVAIAVCAVILVVVLWRYFP